jgi:tRNA (guanine26-N2/guanine27-N2)-dimethyltransferase
MTAVPPVSTATARVDHITVPPGYKLHTENSAHILLPDTDDAFLNPVQEFNRDLSVASIRVWAEQRDAIKKEKWLERQEGKQDSKSFSKRRKCSWVSLDVRRSLI